MYQNQLQGASSVQSEQDYMLAQQASYAAQLRLYQTQQQMGMYSGGYNPYSYNGTGVTGGITASLYL